MPGALEKARKAQLETGFSLQSWMRFSADADLSGGVGKVDEDDDDENWKVWPLAEIRKHNSRDDSWTVIRGRVYNLTPYLPYHPGGPATLDKIAGTDGTALFDKYHTWVSVEALLESCFIGVVASEDEVVAAAGDAQPSAPPSPPSPSPKLQAPPGPRVVWDEASLTAQEAERGVAYGTMKIDQIDTPFLYYEDGLGADGAVEEHAIHSNYLPGLAPALVEKEPMMGSSAAGPRQMSFDELQRMLGLLEMDEHGAAILERPKYTAAGEADFEAKRQATYAGEAQIAAAAAGLPEGWAAYLSRSEPHEIFYFHAATNATQWERPDANVLSAVACG